MNYVKVGNNIQTLRKSLHLSQANLAERIGVTAQAVSKWEKGESLPETYYLPMLSQILGISIDDLLADDVQKSNKTKGAVDVSKIVKGIDEINNLKDYLGEDSLFYLASIKGINEVMNLDFNYIYNNRKDILYIEAIIQALHQGYTVNKKDIDELFKDDGKSYSKIDQYNSMYWDNVYLKKLNSLKIK